MEKLLRNIMLNWRGMLNFPVFILIRYIYILLALTLCLSLGNAREDSFFLNDDTPSKASVSLISNQGDIGKVLKDLGSQGSLRDLATSMLSAGLMDKLSSTFKLPETPSTLFEHAQHNLARGGIDVALNTSIQGEKLSDALKTGLVTAAVRTGAATLSNTIGAEQKEGKLDPVTHKLEHLIVGGVSGLVLNKDFVSGAIGSVVAETVAELVTPEGSTRDQKETSAKIGKFASATTAFMTGKDINTAYATGTTAVENNFLFVPIAIWAIGAGLTAYDTYVSYKEEGLVGAGKTLGTDALITLATGGVAKIATKGVKTGVSLFKAMNKTPLKVVKNTEKVGGKTVVSQPKDLQLEFKKGMRRDFDKKMSDLKKVEGKLSTNNSSSVSKAERRKVTDQYRVDLKKRVETFYKNNPEAKKNALDKLRKSDIDHKIDLQLGGENKLQNLRVLDQSVNRSVGSQIQKQIPKDGKFIIKEVLEKKVN
jgi:hypothetical protein